MRKIFLLSFLSVNLFSSEFKRFMEIRANEDLVKNSSEVTECIGKIAGIARSDLRKIVGFEKAVGSLVTNMQYLSLPSATLTSMGMCAVSPYLGMIAAVCSLVSMLDDDDNEELQHALAQISEQILIFKQDVMKRFDNLEDQIDLSHRRIMNEFISLHRDQQRIKQNILELKGIVKQNQFEVVDKLEQLRRENILRHRDVFNQFATIYTDKVDEVVSNILFDLNCNKIDSSNLAQKVHEVFNCVSITSKNSTLTGSGSSCIEESLSHGALNNTLSHPAYNNVNLIKQYYETRFSVNLGKNVFNPIMFIQCARALTHLISSVRPAFNSEEEKSTCLGEIDFIIREADNALKLLYNELQSNEKIDQIIEDCKSAINQLQTIVNTHIKQEVDSGLKEVEQRVAGDIIAADLATLRGLPAMNFDQLQEDIRAFIYTNYVSSLNNLQKYLVSGYAGHSYGKPGVSYPRYGLMHVARGFILNDPQLLSIRGKNIRNYSWFSKAVQDIKRYLSADERTGQFTHLIDEAKQKYQTNLSQASTRVQTFNLNNIQPISLLIYPGTNAHHSNNKQPLLCTDIKVDLVYIKAERMGLGKIKAQYTCSPKGNFDIDVFFNESHIARYRMGYDVNGCTDEDVINFWYGGIYAKDQDVWRFAGSDDLGPFDHRIKLPVFWEPYAANNTKFSSAQITTYNQNINDVKKLIDQTLAKRRQLANVEILHKLQLPANQFSGTAGQLDRSYKVLEAIVALRIQRPDNPLLKRLFNENGFVKDRNTLLERMNSYSGEGDFDFAQQSSQNLDALKGQVAQVNPDTLILFSSLLKIDEARDVLSLSRITRRLNADERVEELARAQRELRGEFHQLRDDFRGQLGEVRTEFSQSFARLFRLLEAPRGAN